MIWEAVAMTFQTEGNFSKLGNDKEWREKDQFKSYLGGKIEQLTNWTGGDEIEYNQG